MAFRHFFALGLLTLTLGIAGAAPAPATANDADKTFIPHPAWNCGMPEGIPKPEAGKLVLEIDMKLNQAYDIGKTPFGQRSVFVVQGGTVKADNLKATVMTGSLDFQLTLPNGVVEIEQVMVLKTDDNKYIYMRNAGVGTSATDVRVVMDMEAPTNHPSAWVNTGKYVARRAIDPAAKTMKMSIYDIASVTIDPEKAVKIAKPAGVPQQSWDYRKADPSEKQGELLVTENVTLGPSQQVGASENGTRNIIPITGGTLNGGLVPGKVLPGGADYQNFSHAPTIDARYLWQTTGGDIIIVRNTGGGGGARGGPAGGLIPTFEVKTDSKYAWLNTGMGAGGVSLTMYKSTP